MGVDRAVDRQKAVQNLREQVLPRVGRFPGLLAAYWLRPVGDEGLVFMVFRDEDSARVSMQFIGPGFSPMPGIFVKRVELVEVVAHLSNA